MNGSTPSIDTVPDEGGSSAPRMYSSELFPLPDGPVTAATSPAERENDTSDNTFSGPREVEYSFERRSTVSTGCGAANERRFLLMNASAFCFRRHRFVHIQQSIGRPLNAVVQADADRAALAEAARQRPIVPELEQRVGQRFRILGLDEQAAAGFLDDLRERASPRLHDRHAAGEGLEQEDALRLVVRRRHRHHVEALQERQLAGAIDGAVIGELVREAGFVQPALDGLEVTVVRARHEACGFEPNRRAGRAPAK